MDPEEIAEELLQRVAKMRLTSKGVQHKLTAAKFSELGLALESAEFFLYRMEIREANEELNRAIEIVAAI